MLRFASKSEYDRYLAANRDLIEARWLWGQRLRDASGNFGVHPGWCGLCQQATVFTYHPMPGVPINLREELSCAHCELSARARVVLDLVRLLAGGTGAVVYATEQATPAFRWLAGRYPNAIGSEFFTEDQRPRLQQYLQALLGQPLRFEDATRLSLEHASVDALASCDVLEHIPDYRAALAEFARVLRPGGHLLLTVPFMDADEASIQRARIGPDGAIEHLAAPEYHDDPLRSEGVLAFHHFGWDLLATIRDTGFASAHWCLPWDPSQAIFLGLWTLVARR